MMGRDDWTAALIKNYVHQLDLDKIKGIQHEGLSSMKPSDAVKNLVERFVVEVLRNCSWSSSVIVGALHFYYCLEISK